MKTIKLLSLMFFLVLYSCQGTFVDPNILETQQTGDSDNSDSNDHYSAEAVFTMLGMGRFETYQSGSSFGKPNNRTRMVGPYDYHFTNQSRFEVKITIIGDTITISPNDTGAFRGISASSVNVTYSPSNKVKYSKLKTSDTALSTVDPYSYETAFFQSR